jgi:hypothetical protein
MQRALLPALVAVLLVTGDLSAEDIKGTVKKVDADKGTLTVTVKDKDRKFDVPKEAKVTVQVAAGIVTAKDGLKNEWFKRAEEAKEPGYTVEVTVEKKKNKEVATKVHLFTPTRREGPGAVPATGPGGA